MKHESPYLRFALLLAGVAGEEIMRSYQCSTVTIKADGSEVTDADRSAERRMRDLIHDVYPDHGILGEEYGESSGASPYQWVLDPLDGTTWFCLGIPKFGTLIALLEQGLPRVGVIHLPATDETLYAEAQKGCWYKNNGKAPERVRVDDSDSTTKLSQAYVSLSGVDQSELRAGPSSSRFRLGQLLRQSYRIEFVGDCIQHMLVARGRLNASIDAVMYPWDSAAPVACIREAGGVVSGLDGTTDNVIFSGSLLCSSSHALHDTILRLVNDN